MEMLTGVAGEITVPAGKVMPICFNSVPGTGNCLGMIKHGNCPGNIPGGKRKFPECTRYIQECSKGQ
ncbi:MAG: hypothetical protein RBS77_00465 [Candidatus Moranbacteria bacterium]|jgi:hypothetical protein|nr:hypothetical protein [Candidatus Moranbacteria bacterium]